MQVSARMALTDRLAAFGSFPFFHLIILPFLFETLLEITVSAQSATINEHGSYRLSLLGETPDQNIKEQKRMELSISRSKIFHGHIIPIV